MQCGVMLRSEKVDKGGWRVWRGIREHLEGAELLRLTGRRDRQITDINIYVAIKVCKILVPSSNPVGILVLCSDVINAFRHVFIGPY